MGTPLSEGGEFNNLNFGIENFPLNEEFIIESGDFNRTFMLENILVVLDGFILVRWCKVLLSTIRWVGWEIVLNKGEWIGDVFVVEFYVEEFIII